MSALAKVFVVFLFLLCMVFFGAAATLFKTRNNWRIVYNQYREETQQRLVGPGGTPDEPAPGSLAYVIRELSSRVHRQETSLVGLQSQGDDLATRLKAALADIAAERARVVTAETTRDNATLLATSLTSTLEAETVRGEQLRADLHAARARVDNALAELSQTNGGYQSVLLDLAKLQRDLHESRKEYDALTQKHEVLVVWKENVEREYGDVLRLPHGPLAPPISALVQAVDLDEQLVVLSVGRDQKVEIGYEFTIARGSQFIGKVKVIKVYPDLAGAKILFTKEGKEIRVADQAFTVLTD